MSTLLSLGSPIPVNASPDPNVIPVKCLSFKTRILISNLLNPPKVIPTEKGLPRDWRGLAHLVGIKSEKLPAITCDTDETARVLTLWQKQQDVPCTIQKLIDFLEELDRFDVIDDASESIEEDMKVFFETPIVEQEHASSPIHDSDQQILTSDDIKRLNQGLDTQNYDAFVVFADEDVDFATKLIDTMEKQFGFKLCARERDLIAGLPFEHKAIIELISERCNRLIVILSPAYLKSSANKFVVHYAQALGIEQGKRKIIPCIFQRCELPKELRHYFMLDYSRSGKLWDFWDKLRESIEAPPITPRHRRIGIQENFTVEQAPQVLEQIPHQQSELRPALVTPNNGRPRRDVNLSVQFGSLTHLPVSETEETRKTASTHALYTSPSTSTPKQEAAPVKKKQNWFKKKKSWLRNKIPILNST